MLALLALLSPLTLLTSGSGSPLSDHPCGVAQLSCCKTIEPVWFAAKELERVRAPFIADFSLPVGIGCRPMSAWDFVDSSSWYVIRLPFTFRLLMPEIVEQMLCVVKIRLTVSVGELAIPGCPTKPAPGDIVSIGCKPWTSDPNTVDSKPISVT